MRQAKIWSSAIAMAVSCILLLGSLLIFAEPTDESGTTDATSTEASPAETTLAPIETASPEITSEVPTQTTVPVGTNDPTVTTEAAAVTTKEPIVTTEAPIVSTMTKEPMQTTVPATTNEMTTEPPSRDPSIIVGPPRADDPIKFSTGDAYTTTTADQKLPTTSPIGGAIITTDKNGEGNPTISTTARTESGDTQGKAPVEDKTEAKNSLKRLTIISAVAAVISCAALVIFKIFG